MKQLEIKTNKRLLIVEPNNESEYEDIINGDFRFICKGPDLTEDIAYEIVDGFDLSYFVDYNHHNPRAYKLTALESLISAIQSKNYHWGENPVSLEREKTYRNMGDTFKADGILKAWRESESRTFNPSQCIIFEIV